MKISFIATVLNEEKTIDLLLKSISSQSKRPDEVILVDGGSSDKTLELIENWISRIRSDEFREKVKVLVKKGNRSLGRNEAIKKALGDVIVCSDAGCILDKNWVKNITIPFRNKNNRVVGGFYKGISKTVFEKSLMPYVLVMPDRVDPKNFLPSARSIAFRKNVWWEVGGFPQNLSNNEDYFFSRKLKRHGIKFVFKKNALVYFLPRENVAQAFLMFFRYAQGDSESGIVRPKVVLIFIRYILALWFLVYAYFFKLFFIVEVIFYILLLYILWAIFKNYKYVRDREAFVFLPLIQFTSDIAVITGATFGFFKNLWDTREKR